MLWCCNGSRTVVAREIPEKKAAAASRANLSTGSVSVHFTLVLGLTRPFRNLPPAHGRHAIVGLLPPKGTTVLLRFRSGRAPPASCCPMAHLCRHANATHPPPSRRRRHFVVPSPSPVVSRGTQSPLQPSAVPFFFAFQYAGISDLCAHAQADPALCNCKVKS